MSDAAVSPPSALSRRATTDRRLVSSAALTVLSRTVARLTQLALVVAAARLLGVADFAGYSYLFGLITASVVLGDTGVALVVGRDISAGRVAVRTVFWPALHVVAASAVLTALAVFIVGFFDSGPGTRGLPLLLASAVVCANMLVNFESTTLRALGSFAFEAWIQGIGAVVFVTGASLAAAAGLGLTGILGVLLVKEVASLVVAFFALRAEVGAPVRRGMSVGKTLLRRGIRLALASSALVVLTRASLLVLANAGGTDDIAWFSASLRFADAAFLLATTAGFALLPGMAYLAATSPERARSFVRRVLAATFCFGVIAAVIGALAAHPLVDTVFGANFAAADTTTRILFVGLPAYTLLGVAWYVLLAFERERDLLKLVGTAALVSIGLAAALAGPLGDKGAAFAHLVSLSLAAAAAVLLVVRGLR